MKFARFAMPAIALFAIAAHAPADTTPVRYLMTIEGVNPNNQFQVQSFSWGISNPASFSGGGGLTTGKPSLSSFNIMKFFDASDPALINDCFQGTHIANARVRGLRGTNTTPFLDIYMEDVLVDSHQMSASVNNMPMCSASFDFVKITINGVLLDRSILVLNPNRVNDMVASIIQRATASSAKTSHKSKITVH